MELKHFGVIGMHWGTRRARPSALASNKSDSSVTKRVKKDYNGLSDSDFKTKYRTTKDTYAKRVDKYGDPYMNSPLAKAGKGLAKSANDRKIKKTSKPITKTQKIVSSVSGGYGLGVIGSYTVNKLTGNRNSARYAGLALSVIGGKTIYELHNKYPYGYINRNKEKE